MVRCTIKLKNINRAVYSPGDMLKGTIELHLDEPKKLRGLYFNVYGAAKCHWTELRSETVGRGENRRTVDKSVHFKGKDIYLNTRTYLFGSSGGSALEIKSGNHKYEFDCLLPAQLPSSFEALHGNINYYVQAVLDIPWGIDKEFKLPFTLVRHDDLNDFPELKIPVINEEIKQFCNCFCLSDPIVMTVTLPCSVFAPGQKVPIEICYNNNSNVVVQSTRINLKRLTTYNSQTPYRKTKVEVDKMTEISVAGVGASSFKELKIILPIPQVLLSSNNRYCDVVEISYEVKIEAVVSGLHRNISLKFPIEIGSIPLKLNLDSTSPSDVQLPVLPINTEFNENFSNPSAPLLDSLPPTFDEATKINFDENQASPKSLGWNLTEVHIPSAPTEKL